MEEIFTNLDAEKIISDLLYVGLLSGLFLLPKFFQRFLIPSAITALLIGLSWGFISPDFKHDPIVSFLSSIGILALFLLAGLEADVNRLKARRRMLCIHIAIRGAAIVALALCISYWGEMKLRASGLIALALVTPSTGFILDSLDNLPLNQFEQGWVKEKAIASELFALGVMFFLLQTESLIRLVISLGVLLTMILIIPWALLFLARHVTPYAPKSEFSLLVIGAVICGYITKHLGVYFLFGAFLVGFIVGLLREKIPDFHSEKLTDAIGLFSSLFIPFYFFHAGLEVPSAGINFDSLSQGLLLAAVLVPVRLALVFIPRQLTLGESLSSSLRIASPLLPTLIFTLVLGNILHAQQMINDNFYGALLFYTLINSLIPQFLLARNSPLGKDQEFHTKAPE